MTHRVRSFSKLTKISLFCNQNQLNMILYQSWIPDQQNRSEQKGLKNTHLQKILCLLCYFYIEFLDDFITVGRIFWFCWSCLVNELKPVSCYTNRLNKHFSWHVNSFCGHYSMRIKALILYFYLFLRQHYKKICFVSHPSSLRHWINQKHWPVHFAGFVPASVLPKRWAVLLLALRQKNHVHKLSTKLF